MLVHIDACDRSLAHADAGAAVSGDEAAEELEQVRIVADEHDVLAVGVFVDQFLEVCIAGGQVEG